MIKNSTKSKTKNLQGIRASLWWYYWKALDEWDFLEVISEILN
jgi:hypothetical protein